MSLALLVVIHVRLAARFLLLLLTRIASAAALLLLAWTLRLVALLLLTGLVLPTLLDGLFVLTIH
ncbi:MAG: hypothetical protein AB7F09_20890 [Parvibaculaceae bacterium]